MNLDCSSDGNIYECQNSENNVMLDTSDDYTLISSNNLPNTTCKNDNITCDQESKFVKRFSKTKYFMPAFVSFIIYLYDQQIFSCELSPLF